MTGALLRGGDLDTGTTQRKDHGKAPGGDSHLHARQRALLHSPREEPTPPPPGFETPGMSVT